MSLDDKPTCVTVDGGKYTFGVPRGDYRVHVARYGEPWLIIEQGSKAIHSLYYELNDARAEILELQKEIVRLRERASPCSGLCNHGEDL